MAAAGSANMVREYIKKMLLEVGGGMKVLLVDTDTMAVVSAVHSQSDILKKEVFLVEYLGEPERVGELGTGGDPASGGLGNDDGSQESLQHMKAVCFLRPTAQNFALLSRHLRSPKYGEYHCFFSNMVRDAFLQELAEADEKEVVMQVQEFYADFVPLDPTHFTVPLEQPHMCFLPANTNPQGIRRARDRCVEGLAAAMLSMKRRPLIRYQRSSENARSIALDMWRLMYEQEVGLFDFRRSSGATVLLVVDRLDDPITPLLTQWTYQAMVHELIGLQHHRLDLRSLTGRDSKDQGEVVMSPMQDDFYAQHMYDNYGDLGIAVKGLVDEFQVASKSNTNISSIEDMQRFVENYPEFRSKSSHVSKHVTVLSELNKTITSRSLMTASAQEQELACSSNMSAHHVELMTLLNDPKIREEEKLRLVVLFSLRYEQESGGSRLRDQMLGLLGGMGTSKAKLALVAGVMQAAGAEARTGDLFGTKTFSARASKMVSSLKGVDNVYTQHQPLILQTLENLSKGKLKEADYPTVGTAPQSRDRPPEVVVFIVGGSTYEEAKAVHQFNQQQPKDGGMRVTLGGTMVHNSQSFLSHIGERMKAMSEMRH